MQDNQGTYKTVKAHTRQSRHMQDSQGTYKTVKAHIRQSRHMHDNRGTYNTAKAPLPDGAVLGGAPEQVGVARFGLDDPGRLFLMSEEIGRASCRERV